MSMLDTVDRAVARMLWVTPPAPIVVETDPDDDDAIDPSTAPATRAFGFSLAVSAVRCTLQYMILPLALPLIGLTTNASLPLVILLDLLAIALLVRSLRYFWQTRHPRRFDMLPLSLIILLMVFGALGFDLWQLFT